MSKISAIVTSNLLHKIAIPLRLYDEQYEKTLNALWCDAKQNGSYERQQWELCGLVVHISMYF